MVKYVPICNEYVHTYTKYDQIRTNLQQICSYLPNMVKYVPICNEYVPICKHVHRVKHQYSATIYIRTQLLVTYEEYLHT